MLCPVVAACCDQLWSWLLGLTAVVRRRERALKRARWCAARARERRAKYQRKRTNERKKKYRVQLERRKKVRACSCNLLFCELSCLTRPWPRCVILCAVLSEMRVAALLAFVCMAMCDCALVAVTLLNFGPRPSTVPPD